MVRGRAVVVVVEGVSAPLVRAERQGCKACWVCAKAFAGYADWALEVRFMVAQRWRGGWR